MTVRVFIAVFAAVLLGAAALGGTAGWLIGITGDDSQVPAAVVAGLMASLLGWLIFASWKDCPRAWALAGSVTVVFCGSLFTAENMTTNRLVRDAGRILDDELTLRRFLLDWCSETEFYVNRDRARARMPPLSSEFVCAGILPPSISNVRTELGEDLAHFGPVIDREDEPSL